MSQVTIYLEPESLAAAKSAAARAQLSLSKWFARLVEAEQSKAPPSWEFVLEQMDAAADDQSTKALDFLLDPQQRAAAFGQDATRMKLG